MEDARFDRILDELVRMASGEVELRLNVGDSGDQWDALAFGINALTSELGYRQKLVESAHRQAEESDRAKGRFLASVTHEFRTPLTAILATADHLARTESEPAAEERALVRIRKNARQLLRLVEDIMDFARLGHDHFKAKPTEFSPREVVEGVLTGLEDQARAQGNALTFLGASSLPKRVEADASWLERILNNLLGNALKFTEHGQVTLGASWSLEGGMALMVFDVTDTGLGIPAEFQARLFTPFERADAVYASHIRGTGLGLSVARGLARATGGDLRLIESREKLGSRFEAKVCARLVEA